MTLVLKAVAPDIAYTMNPIVYAWETDHASEYNARMVMEILMIFDSGPEVIGMVEKRPNQDNIYVFNIAELLNDAIEQFDILAVTELNWDNPLKICSKTQRTYQIRVTEFWGDPENTDGYETPFEKKVVRGGLQHQEFPIFHDWFKGFMPKNKMYLSWLPLQMTIHPKQPITLFLMNYRDIEWSSIKMEFKMDFWDPISNSHIEHTIWKDSLVAVSPGEIIIFPVDPTSADLYSTDPDKQLTSYSVTAYFEETIISETRTYHIDWIDRPDQKTFAYLNSLGGIDHIRCYGSMHPKVDFTQGNAERDAMLYFNGTLQTLYDPTIPIITNFNLEESESVKVFSGAVSHREVDCFRDFKLSPLKFEYLDRPQKRYIPIVIDQKSFNLPKTGNYPFYFDFTFKYAFNNRVYTPKYLPKPK